MTAAMLVALSLLAAPDGPRVTHLGAVAPDVLEVVIQVGRAVHGTQRPYVAEPGDRVVEAGTNQILVRDGAPTGNLVGPRRDVLTPYDSLVGEGRDRPVDRLDDYRLQSPDDPAFAQPTAPTALHRWSRPTDLARTAGWTFDSPLEHHVFLRLPAPLRDGRRYTVGFGDIGPAPVAFRFDPARLRSEAVHVSQVGFHPDDPDKVAYLSCWLGDGGGLDYPAGLPFEVVDAGTGEVAAAGVTVLAKAADDLTEDAYRQNHNGTDVWRMEFSGLTRPGSYRVVVDGIGCSFDFAIAADAWRRAFAVAARGFYHLRSGLALGPPHTEFRRPRCFHPDDGVTILHSTCGLLDSRNGLGDEPDNFGRLNAGRTAEVVADAWGGHQDAGDWDRRIQHLVAYRYLIELTRLSPELAAMNLNLPESGGRLPDLLDEALFGLDCYRRMQTPDGGIRGGIESAEHPNQGEASWQETLPIMAYAPDPWSSYVYAGVAAQAAAALDGLDADLAATYLDSALRAMEWAEAELPNRPAGDPHAVADARNLAAADLFSVTGDQRWHRLFLDTTVFRQAAELEVWQEHEQREAAWVYLRCRQPGVDEAVREFCRAATLREADDRLAWTARTGFGWTKNAWAPFAWGALTTPPVTLARAWLLTGDAQYLAGTVRACGAATGANPLNLCYTTGVGQRYPLNPLHLDSRHTGQPAPPGLTVFGPMTMPQNTGDFAFKLVAPHAYPALETWPSQNAFFDVFWWPSMVEFTVHQPMAAVAYVWGVLASR